MNKNNIQLLATVALMALSASALSAQTKAPFGTAMPHRGLNTLKLSETNRADGINTVRTMKSRAPLTSLAPSSFYGRTFYGSLINSNDWNNVSIAQVPYGIYSFEIGDDIAPQAVMTDLGYNFLSGAYTGYNFIGIYAMQVMGGLNGARYITIDPAAKKELKNVMYDTSKGSYSLLPSVMAYNNIDNTIYSMQYNDELSGLNWCSYNTDYDWMDKIAAFRGKYNVLTLGNTPDGEMYFINAYGDLYRINRANGRPSLIAWTGTTPLAYSQSMTYDNRTGLFLWAAITDEGNCLYSVDPETAQTELVSKFGKQEQFSAIYSLEESAKDDAPAKVGDLKLDFSQAGGLDGTITFTLPKQTYAGAALGMSTSTCGLTARTLRALTSSLANASASPSRCRRATTTLR